MGDHNSSVPGTPGEDTSPSSPLDDMLLERRQLKAISTSYAGCEFRSRLEARWAVFFDAMKIEWQYEPEGFILSPFGEWYLPDFYLPDLGYWIEVKPESPDKRARRKAYLFDYSLARETDPARSRWRAFIVHGGIPWPHPKQGNIIGFSTSPEVQGDPSRWDLCWQMCPICQQLMIGRIDTMACRGCEEEFGTLVQDALDSIESIPTFEKLVDVIPAMVSGAVNTEFFRSGYRMPKLKEAYGKARAARFEGARRRRSA